MIDSATRGLASLGFEFGQVVGRTDQAVPVLLNVLWRPADLSHNVGHLLGGDHFDGIPRADLEIVWIRLFSWNVHADFAADAAFDIDFAPTLEVVKVVVLLHLKNAVDRTDFDAGLATGAVVR